MPENIWTILFDDGLTPRIGKIDITAPTMAEALARCSIEAPNIWTCFLKSEANVLSGCLPFCKYGD